MKTKKKKVEMALFAVSVSVPLLLALVASGGEFGASFGGFLFDHARGGFTAAASGTGDAAGLSYISGSFSVRAGSGVTHVFMKGGSINRLNRDRWQTYGNFIVTHSPSGAGDLSSSDLSATRFVRGRRTVKYKATSSGSYKKPDFSDLVMKAKGSSVQ